MALTNKEKTQIRNKALNEIAQAFSEHIPEFREFAENKWQGDITWRKFETYLKKEFGLSRVPGEFDRNQALNIVADLFVKRSKDFQTFVHSGYTHEVTWRKFETYLKNRFQDGPDIDIIHAVKKMLENKPLEDWRL
ncbi:MAG: hypothetical protein EHM33_01945 [Chloroflexi bacterium]|nr:MAG: hypothetical protein EHM33_01945 [Chloroflexota bacterium]